MIRALTLAVFSLAAFASCTKSTARRSEGVECELASDCTSPLVCTFGRCRVACASSRDCAAGLECLIGDDGLGACQLRQETTCGLSSECPAGLRCLMSECRTECSADVDCAAGARCAMGACVDTAESACAASSECMPPFVCGRDRKCRFACRAQRDCRPEEICVPETAVDAGAMSAGGTCFLPNNPPSFDAMVSDTGQGTDAGSEPPPGDAAITDTSVPDAPPIDSSPTDSGGPAPFIGVGVAVPTVLGLGRSHSCAITPDGPLYRIACWGGNGSWQVSMGMPVVRAPSDPAAPPTAMPMLGVGLETTCWFQERVPPPRHVLTCRGSNIAGQADPGVAAMMSFDIPHPLPTAPPLEAEPSMGASYVSIGGGEDLVGGAATYDGLGGHTCILVNVRPPPQGGQLYCWGRHDHGQTATIDGALPYDQMMMIPSPIGGGMEYTRVATGARHTCAVEADGDVVCFGDNRSGQLGAPAAMPGSMTPVLVEGLPDPRSSVGPPSDLACGAEHCCALYENAGSFDAGVASRLYCWGNNTSGQCGQPVTMPFLQSAMPVVPSFAGDGGVAMPVEPRELALGGRFTCVRASAFPFGGGDIFCFGNNTDGVLGTTVGVGVSTEVPTQIVAGTAARVAAGDRHACYVEHLTHHVYCWGDNTNRQVTDSMETRVPDPRLIVMSMMLP